MESMDGAGDTPTPSFVYVRRDRKGYKLQK